MQIKITTDYALRMLTYLAMKGSVANSKEISDSLDLPQKNVLSIGRELKKGRIVNIISGPYGGYVMRKPPRDILLYDVVVLFEDIRISRRAESRKNGQKIVDVVVNKVYSELQGMIELKLKSYTLADWVSKDIKQPAV